MIRCFLSAVLTAIPAMLFASLVFTCFEPDEYYTPPWQIASVVFLAASFVLGLIFSAPPTEQHDSNSAIVQRFFACPALAWMLAVAVLFGLSFTPMVLGQDNGDGANGYTECMLFAVLSSTIYSGIVLMIMLLNAVLLAPLLCLMQTKVSVPRTSA